MPRISHFTLLFFYISMTISPPERHDIKKAGLLPALRAVQGNFLLANESVCSVQAIAFHRHGVETGLQAAEVHRQLNMAAT